MTLGHRLDLDGRGNVRAILGPTNTGKTHRAVERMLAHKTGMIGLPLRLLAREVYDRVVAAKGEAAVALVTGEEKRIPADPRWWVCTVEAMPTDRPVAFVAVDEVQLAADPTRGHVFTDRILRSRGLQGTLFLGSDTIAPLLAELVPTVEIERHPRMSTLRATPHRKLTSVPPRSAVVAFSAESVYALAERLRVHHGGTAVVLGALSPRARNAQIALYQSGDVQHIVATDAIGMGLNLDVDHVAFAEARKFDGRGPRALSAAEVAQIAGRAGRHTRDGTFGSTTDLELDPEIVAAVEAHQFPRLVNLFWRNPDLDRRTIDGLLGTLEHAPPHRALLRMRDAEDHRHLEQLAGRASIRALATGPERVALLWDVCGVPDFRKTRTDLHVDLLEGVYLQLARVGVLGEDFVAKRVRDLDRTEGDIEVLMARIAGIRTWNFLAHRRDWVADAAGWQARARDVEDRLSDALHARLTERFVDPRAMVVKGGAAPTLEADAIVLDGQRLGRLRGFGFEPEPGLSERTVKKTVHQLLAPLVEQRVTACAVAPDAAFAVDPERWLRWDGAPIARVEPGPDRLSPVAKLLRLDLLEGTAREQVQLRADAWLRGRVTAAVGRFDPDGLSDAGRGLLWAVRQELGMVWRADVADQLQGLTAADRRGLARRGVHLGRELVWSSGGDRAARALLWGIFAGADPLPPAPEKAVFPLDRAWPPSFYAAIGYVPVGARAVRADVYERRSA
jgi:ATP-dependent RNA helicase SUPV3L1/SUV3